MDTDKKEEWVGSFLMDISEEANLGVGPKVTSQCLLLDSTFLSQKLSNGNGNVIHQQFVHHGLKNPSMLLFKDEHIPSLFKDSKLERERDE